MADQADYADNAENESSEAGRSARGTTSRRRAAAPEPAAGAPLDAQPAEPTLDLFGDGPAPEFIGTHQGMSPKVSRAMASPAARRAARQKTAPLAQEPALDPVADPAEPYFHVDPPSQDAPAQAAATEAAETTENVETPNPAEVPPEPAAKPASAFSYAPTSASGSPAHLSSVVHASDFEAAVHGPVHDQADKSSRAESAAALALQARRTKWMLTAAVAALVVTTVVAVVETTMLANFSADSQAQQQRIELLLQNQQAALDKINARLDAPPPAEPAAAVVAAPVAAAPARAQSASAPSRHAARVAKAKAAEKEKAASHAAAKAHAQSGTRQTPKN
jgi:hypothetical protein